MFGWRARIGVIHPLPGSLPFALLEMERLAPDGVVFVTRLLDGPVSLETPDLVAMLPQIEPLARELARKTNLDVIHMAGAPIVLANGPDRMIRLLEEATGLPATTNVAAIVNGLRRLGMQRLVVVTPYYPPSAIELLRGHLEATGFEIVALAGGDPGLDKMQAMSQEQTYRLAKQAIRREPGADGLLIVGGGSPLYEVIETLEVDTGKPVVANNYASLWSVLTLASVREPIRGYGKLLTCF